MMRTSRCAYGLGLIFSLLAMQATVAQEPATEPDPAPPPAPARYPVTAVRIAYPADLKGLPAAVEVLDAEVRLTKTDGAWAAWQEGDEPTSVKLAEIGSLPTHEMAPTAIRAISQTIVRAINQRGLGGVRVELDPAEIGPDGADLRPPDQTALTFLVSFVPIAAVQTEAFGERFDGNADTLNRPAHAEIRHGSPVGNGTGDQILRTDLIEDYVQFLSRHPGRRVDVAITPGDVEGTFALKYLVQENKPWLIYAQASNDGTPQTSKWRETFGFTHYQLTGHDDILSVTYSTAGFDASHAASGSYDAPFPGNPRWRGKVYGSWSQYDASEVGLAGAGFEGETSLIGGEIAWNFYQQRDWFIDAVAGLSFESQYVNNRGLGTEQTEPFVLPMFGVRSQKVTETASFFGATSLTWNASGLAGTDAGAAVQLGRAAVNSTWLIWSWNVTGSVYLEPLLNRRAWDDLATPETSTLAHEVMVSCRGQYIFDDRRTIPQHERTVGGLYTVRGYDESTAVGDNAVILTAEYRFHIPRALPIEEQPRELFGQPFRFAPASPRGRPDWDLVLKAFIDYGQTSNNNFQPGDDNQDLLGTGVGAELQLLRNLTVRVDWGVALKDSADQQAGDNRFHIVATVLY